MEEEKEKHCAGRPTDYRQEYCNDIVMFFTKNIENSDVIKKSEGTGIVEFPTFEKFATTVGVTVKTLLNWCEKHEEFLQAYEKSKQLQKNFLIQAGLNGLYAPAAFCFVAKNCTDMRDKTEVDNNHAGEVSIKITDYRKPSGDGN